MKVGSQADEMTDDEFWMFQLQLPSAKGNDQVTATTTNTPSKTKQRIQKKKNESEREINTHPESTFSGTPHSPFTNRELVMNNFTGSQGPAPEMKETTKEMKPTRSHSKEAFTPVGAQYRSKIK